jgi:ABC-2 type transport system ATP-binding protein
MSTTAITVNGLKKSYGPDNLSFEIPRGVISAFLGPNGSGKTTTLRILMGLAHPSSGRASLLGVPAGSTHEIFRKVAFVPENKELYPMARAGEMIRMTRGFYPEFDNELAHELIDEWEIPERKFCQHLSKGNKAKLWLILAVCRRPELLVLDEPTDGFDPVGIERTLQLLVEHVAECNATVFFSTHRLAEVEQIAEHIVMIRQGRCIAAGDIDELRSRMLRVRCLLPEGAAQVPPELAGWQRDGRIVTGFSELDRDELGRRLEPSGVTVLDAGRSSLKEFFLQRMEDSK